MSDKGLGAGGIPSGGTALAADRLYALRDPTGTPTDVHLEVQNLRGGMGIATTDSPEFAGVNFGHASDTRITRGAAGVPLVAGNPFGFLFPTVADLAGRTIPATVLYLATYEYSTDNGGGARRKREASDDGSGVQSLDGAWWCLAEDRVDGRMWGMISDGTTVNTTAFQRAINYCKQRKRRLHLSANQAGCVFLTGPLTIDSPSASDRHSVEIVGESWEGDIGTTTDGGVTIKLAASSDDNLFTIGTEVAPCRFENLLLDGNRDSQTQGASVESWAVYFTDYNTDFTKKRSGHFYNCYILSFLSGGVYIGRVRNAGTMDRVTILNVGERINGTAQAVGATTMTLAASASSVDSAYVGKLLVVTGSTGNTQAVSQIRTITGYVGATRVATVDSAWDITPSGTVSYRVNIENADCIQIGSCNDWRIYRCDVGSATRYGVHLTGGGSIDFEGTNTFTNDQGGLRVTGTALDMVWLGGSIDTNKMSGAAFVGSTTSAGVVYSRQLIGVRFNQNGIGKDDTYYDVSTSNEYGLSIVSPKMLLGSLEATGNRRVKYFLNTSGGGPVALVNPRHDNLRSNVLATGTAQAGGASSITLASGALATDDIYNNAYVYITSGTGAGEANIVSDYVGSTKVATVHTAWGVTPDATSVYEISARPVYTTALTNDYAKLRGYEETGTGTVTVTHATPGDLSVTYTAQALRYTLNGNRCFVDIDLAWTPTFTTASGEWRISGLPFAANASSRGSGTLRSKSSNVTFPASCTQVNVQVAPSVTYLRLIGLGSTVAAAGFNTSNFTSGAAHTLQLSVVYEI